MKNRLFTVFLLATPVFTYLIAISLSHSLQTIYVQSDEMIVSEITKKAHKALVLGDFTELNGLKLSDELSHVGYKLINALGEEVDAHHSVMDSSTISYHRIITGTANNVSALLISDTVSKPSNQPVRPVVLGELEVFFTRTHFLFQHRYLVAFMLSLLVVASMIAVWLNYKMKLLHDCIYHQNTELRLVNSKFEFYANTLKSIFNTLSTDFKVANDVLSYQSSMSIPKDNDYVALYAKNKMERSLYSLLAIKDKVFEFNPDMNAPEVVYFFGNPDKTEMLRLCFQVNGIELVYLKASQSTQVLTASATILIDLDPMANDQDDVMEMISLIPDCAYVIGLLFHDSSDCLADEISSRLNWTLKHPISIETYTETIIKKPSVRKLIDAAL